MGAFAGSDELLACTYDTYGGVIVEPSSVPHTVEQFRQRMSSSLVQWRKDGRAGVWLELSIGDAQLIPVATGEFGFEFHSVENKHMTLKLWLPEDRPSSLPGGASHTVGVGAIVVDEAAQKLLLLREKTGPAARLGVWKIPTGLVEAGEELHEAAAREVREETGVEAEFVDVRACRMAHLGNLAHKGKSNLLFIVRLRSKAGASASAPCPDDKEIAEARWFTFEEYDALPHPEKGSLFDVLNRSALHADARLVARELSLGSKRTGTQWLYYPEAVAS